MPVDIKLIRHSEALADLPESVQQDISRQASLLRIPGNTVLFDSGNSCSILPLVVCGSIRVFKQSESGREISLYRVNKNELCIITLSCLLEGGVYPATGVTEDDVAAIVLPRALFLQLIATQDRFRETAFHLFAERLSGLMQLIEEITFHKLDQRLALLLLRRGPLIHESHQQLADELGSVREIVSRLLKQFEEKKWIRLARKQVEIVDADALQEFTERYR